jgi:hypothetical protein
MTPKEPKIIVNHGLRSSIQKVAMDQVEPELVNKDDSEQFLSVLPKAFMRQELIKSDQIE